MAEETTGKRAAIEFEEVEDTPLSELSADRFLEALNQENLVPLLRVWPEKKKYELFHEPENVGEIPLGRLRNILENEKKKVEIEIPPGGRFGSGHPMPAPFQPGQYDQLVNRLADDLERRFKGRLER